MAEYRRAYERAKKDKLKIIAFVRLAVWDEVLRYGVEVGTSKLV